MKFRNKVFLYSLIFTLLLNISVFSDEMQSFKPTEFYTDDIVLQLPFLNSLTDTSAVSNMVSIGAGTASYTAGAAGNTNSAFNFNGSTYLSLGSSSQLNPSSLMVSFWVKPIGNFSGEHIFLWTKNKYNNNGWYIGSNSDTKPIVFSIGIGSGGSGSGQPYEICVNGTRSTFFPANTWTHIAATFDGTTREAHIYRNGIKQIIQIFNSDSQGEVYDDVGVSKYIGRNGGHGSTLAKYALDDVTLFKRVFSQNEVIALAEETKTFSELELQAILDADASSLAIPKVITEDVILPSKGDSGSLITWISSDNSDVLTTKGSCTQPIIGDSTVNLTAMFSLNGQSLTKIYSIKITAPPPVFSDVGTDNVELLDDYLINAETQDVNFLLSLSPNRFLYHFYSVAGVTQPTGNVAYDNLSGEETWERTSGANFRGHMFGHYMSALSMAYLSEKDLVIKAELLAKIKECVSGLTVCQDAYGKVWNGHFGYIAPFPESRLQSVDGAAGGSIVPVNGNVIVPYYNLHKVIAGLIAIYNNVKDDAISQTALNLVSNFGDYFYNCRVSQVDKSKMLNTEYGGMNDAFYDLYAITGNVKHKVCAEAFDEVALFNTLASGMDNLAGKHANTTIPKFIGALKRYTTMMNNKTYYNALTSSEISLLPNYLSAAEKFFDIVVEHHTYITGANSQSEHFHASDKLWADASGTADNTGDITCETCNEYNMLKLARELFKVTGNKKYLDYYERAFINTIVSSQDPTNGSMTYFNPMASGFFKVFNKNRFWCCTGTGVENFVKLGDSIYFKGLENGGVYVNLYYSSKLILKERNLILSQSANMPVTDTVTFSIASADGQNPVLDNTNLYLRKPDWISENHVIKINGINVPAIETGGFIVIQNVQACDIIEVTFPMKAEVWDLPDNKNVVAFKYGPVVLSAGVGKNNMNPHNNGILVLASNYDSSAPRTIYVTNGQSVAEWKGNIVDNLVRLTDGVKSINGTDFQQVRFALQGTNLGNLVFTPHYMNYDERYTLYMNIALTDSQEYMAELLTYKCQLREKEAASAYLSTMDANNYEAAYDITTNGTSKVGTYRGRNYRDAIGNGTSWFQYNLPIVEGQVNYLNTTYVSADNGRTFKILINDEVFVTEILNSTDQTMDANGFYALGRTIPSKYTNGGEVKHGIINGIDTSYITVRIAQNGTGPAGGLYGISITQDYDKTPDLQDFHFTSGLMSLSYNSSPDYILKVAEGTSKLMFKAVPHKLSGLVYIGNILFDDTQYRTVNFSGNLQYINLTSYAQDHITNKTYNIKVETLPDISLESDFVIIGEISNKEDTYSACYSVDNNSTNDVGISMFIVAYDTSGKIIKISIKKEELSIGNSLPSISFTVPEAKYVKAFIWGLDNNKPITEVIK